MEDIHADWKITRDDDLAREVGSEGEGRGTMSF